MLKQLKIYYVFVTLPFVMLLVGAAAFFDAIKATIIRNPHPQINYTIFVIILVGGAFIILNAYRLIREAKTLVEYSGAIRAKTDIATLQKMANLYTTDISCLLQMVAASSGRSISHQEQVAIEHELTNTRARLNRRNALPQYLTGLLVGMGLLGTFIGLLATLNDISILISSFADLDMNSVDPIQVFRIMIERMKAPMQSMGIAFSASMYGLLGSIILGLMMVGIRRLQGDIFSMLSSEIARHIEIALSHESITYRSGVEYTGDVGDIAKVLIRVEERLADGSRLQQRTLSSVLDDFQKQRSDMLRTLTEQTEASNNFRSELQQLGRQLSFISNIMEKSNGEVSSQISELTVHLAGDAKETHKLLSMQIDEQKKLRNALDSYKIEERLAEAARLQQRMLSSVVDDLQKQRSDMLRTLTEQTDSNNNFRSELQNLGSKLGEFSTVMEKGNEDISFQVSELTVHLSADARESQILINTASNSFRNELQQLGNKIDNQLVSLASVAETGNSNICQQISKQMDHVSAHAKESRTQFEAANNDLCSELRHLSTQLGAIFTSVEKGKDEISTHVSGLMGHLSADAAKSRGQLETVSNDFRIDLQQLGHQLDIIFTSLEKSKDEISTHVSGLMDHLSADAAKSRGQLETVSNEFRSDLQQLGHQLGAIFASLEKGNEEIRLHVSGLMGHLSADAKESRAQFGTASDDFRNDLQCLIVQLGSIPSVIEKVNHEVCTHITQLMNHRTEDEQAPHERLTMQVNDD